MTFARTPERVVDFCFSSRMTPFLLKQVCSHNSICERNESKKNARCSSLNDKTRTFNTAYLCCSWTWKKPRFQPKTQFSWLSLTLSLFLVVRCLLYAQGDFLATRTYFISPAKKLKMDQKLTSKQPRHFLTRSTQDE